MSLQDLPHGHTVTPDFLPSTPLRIQSENIERVVNASVFKQSPVQVLKRLAVNASARKEQAFSPGGCPSVSSDGLSTDASNAQSASGTGTELCRNVVQSERRPFGVLYVNTPASTPKSILKRGLSTKSLSSSVSWSSETHFCPIPHINISPLHSKRMPLTPRHRRIIDDIVYETAQPSYPSIQLQDVDPVPSDPPRNAGDSTSSSLGQHSYAARYLAGIVPGPTPPPTGLSVAEPSELDFSDSSKSISDILQTLTSSASRVDRSMSHERISDGGNDSSVEVCHPVLALVDQDVVDLGSSAPFPELPFTARISILHREPSAYPAANPQKPGDFPTRPGDSVSPLTAAFASSRLRCVEASTDTASQEYCAAQQSVLMMTLSDQPHGHVLGVNPSKTTRCFQLRADAPAFYPLFSAAPVPSDAE